MDSTIVHNGYIGFRAIKGRKLSCPHCSREQEDVVEDYCVLGRPDKSKDTCVYCDRPFGVIFKQNSFFVVKIYTINDNIM